MQRSHMFGRDRLTEILTETAAENIGELADAIIQQVTEYRHGPRRDDLTLIIAKLR